MDSTVLSPAAAACSPVSLQSLSRAASLALLVGVLAGCGGGHGGGDNHLQEQSLPVEKQAALVATGHLYPATAGIVLVEYDGVGVELQRSSMTDASGSFQFPRRLSGSRLEAVTTTSADRVAPVYSSQLVDPADITNLEITPLTTWYDQLVANGVSPSAAASRIQGQIATSCTALAESFDPKYLTAAMSMPAPDHDWLLSAASAYLKAARKLGVGPKVDFAGWSSALDRHGETLSQLCAFSAAVSDPAWAKSQADRLARESGIKAADAARLNNAIARARTQGLAFLAQLVQIDEYPAQTALLQARSTAGHELSLASDFVMAQYPLSQIASTTPPASASGTSHPSAAAAQEFAGLGAQQGVAISSSGLVVSTLQASSTAVATGAATMRLLNESSADKSVLLNLNGQDLDDMAGVIKEIVAMPVAYTGEPLYRKAWRYLVGHRRDTEPLAISFFQFQPDLWLRSVGSSYCEAQAAVLYRIWRAMGYEGRVVGLTGHVTAEVLVDGHWKIFDPFLGVYYTDRLGQIVGVAELEQDPSLITNPHDPMVPLDSAAYSSNVAGIFASADDNGVASGYMTTEPAPMDSAVQIPAGGYLEINSSTNVALESTEGPQIDMSTAKLWVPPGYTGTLRLPLLLRNVQGDGSVRLLGRTVDASGAISENHGLAALGSLDTTSTDSTLGALLQSFYFNDTSDLGVTEIEIDSSGPGGLTLTLMLNPLYFKSQQQLTMRTSGADLGGLRFVAPSSSAAPAA